jgi:hypothetical protein
MSLKTLAVAAVLAAAGLGLSACGKVGQLERPGPLFGAERNTTQDADKAVRTAQDPNKPVDTIDPRDRSTDPAPPRTLPIPGTSPGATGLPPPGAIPQVYNNPR